MKHAGVEWRYKSSMANPLLSTSVKSRTVAAAITAVAATTGIV
jgi:hypothetical protein